MDCFANCILILLLILIVIFIIRIPETFEDEVEFPTLGITKKGDEISVDKLGIGISDPSSNLDIKGDDRGSELKMYQNNNSKHTSIKHDNGSTIFSTKSDENPSIKFDLDDGSVIKTALFAKHDGKIGIGHTNPIRKLDIDGGLKSKHILTKSTCFHANEDINRKRCLNFNNMNMLLNKVRSINNIQTDLTNLNNGISELNNRVDLIEQSVNTMRSGSIQSDQQINRVPDLVPRNINFRRNISSELRDRRPRRQLVTPRRLQVQELNESNFTNTNNSNNSNNNSNNSNNEISNNQNNIFN